jgi:UDP-N-acetylmuramate--alanine ligase
MIIDVPTHVPAARELGRVHLVGIGGAGLSAIARLMHAEGVRVSGSDAADSAVLQALIAEGIECHVGHGAEHVEGADVVIASTAIHETNPEVRAALERGIALWPRSAGMRSLMIGRRTVAVAGTHGKTTTTAMLTCALQAAGMSPTFAIGAEVAALGTNAARGSGELFVAEADESDGAFLTYRPQGAIVTNVDADHLDVWGTPEAYAAGFAEFVGTVGEFVVLCGDDPGALALADSARAAGLDVLLAGLGSPGTSGAGVDGLNLDVRASGLEVSGRGMRFIAWKDGEELGAIELAVPGAHYVVDAMLALAAGLRLGAPFAALADGLARYSGADRRMQFLGEAAGVRVYDSYAHHPTEIAADIAAARAVAGDDRLVVAFQPHLFSRTRVLGAEMGRALSAADEVVVADIYPARESPEPGVTAALVADAVHGPPVRIGGPVGGLAGLLAVTLRRGDLLLTLGAGDVSTVGPRVLKALADSRRV